MLANQPLPRLWLITDERLPDTLGAVARLPRGAGIVFRHFTLVAARRNDLFRKVRAIARRDGKMLLLAGPAGLAYAWGADGSHGRGAGAGFRSAPVHDLGEIRAAERDGADMLFLSPVFATRSHPGAPALGPARFGLLCRQTRLPVVALGGMNGIRARTTDKRGGYGWAGIDAFTR
jgi:thiamine-phosphate pyrophosphorylase